EGASARQHLVSTSGCGIAGVRTRLLNPNGVEFSRDSSLVADREVRMNGRVVAFFRDFSSGRRRGLFLIFAILSSLGAAAQWLQYPTPGIPRMPDGKPNLFAPLPRIAGGKPDLSGIWAAECAIYGRDGCFTQSMFFDIAKGLKPG